MDRARTTRTLFGKLESAMKAITPFTMISAMVNHTRKGFLLPILSDRAPRSGQRMSTKTVAKEKLAPYRISGTPLSKISHWVKNIAPIAIVMNEFPKS